MKATEIKTGDTFQTYYGNGTPSRIVNVTRTTDKSIFVENAQTENGSENREGINSVQRYLDDGMWAPIPY